MSIEEQIQKAFERVDAKIHDMYVEKLMNHDWTSDMSDDHRRFTDGMREYEEILSIARNVDRDYKIFNIYAPDGYKKESEDDN